MWQAMLLAISSNLDDLTIAFSLGLKEDVLTLRNMLIIAIISGLTMGAGIQLGNIFSVILMETVEKFISFLVFSGFGIWFIIEGIRDDSGVEYKAVKKYTSKNTNGRSILSAVGLGLVLGIGSLALGFSGGLGRFPLLFTSIMTTVSSFLFLWMGIYLGENLSRIVGKYGHYAAGVILLLLGFYELM